MADRSHPWSATHIVLGTIGAPWGIKGWVKLFSWTDPPENLLDYRRFWLAGPDGLEEIEIDQAKPHGGALVGHIAGCDVREACGRYTGRELLVPKELLPKLKDEYYWHQLEGLEVRTLSGEVLGRVDHLFETGANDVMVVRQQKAPDSADAGSGSPQNADNAVRDEPVTNEPVTERLLPWIEGQVVREVNLDQGYILVDWDKDWI